MNELTAFKSPIGIGYIRCEDNMVKEVFGVPSTISMQLSLSLRLGEQCRQERITGATACAVEDKDSRGLVPE